MGSIPFALSVSHFINSVGAKAGFAAILGLAVLILLYFAQARETATLRERASESDERIRQLDGRLNQLMRVVQAQAQQVAQPQQAPQRQAPAPAGAALRPPAPARIAPVTAGALAGAGSGAAVAAPPPFVQPIAPAGVGAPALSAATKLIPTDVPAPSPAAVAPPPPAFERELANGDANGHTPVPAAVPPPRPTGAGTLLAAAQGTAAPGGNPPRVQIGGPAGSGQRRPPANRPFDVTDEEPPSSPVRRILAGIAALVVIAAVVIILIKTTGGNSGSPRANTAASTPTTNAPAPTTRHKHHTPINPANVSVSVLNGTATANAAKGISDKLGAKGYKAGCVTNALTQTQTTTQIAYFDTFRRDALAVARVLNLPTSDVVPINPGTESISCAPQPPITNSNVVVTVGSDLAAGAAVSAAGASSSGSGSSTAAAPPTGTQPLGPGTGTNPTSTVG